MKYYLKFILLINTMNCDIYIICTTTTPLMHQNRSFDWRLALVRALLRCGMHLGTILAPLCMRGVYACVCVCKYVSLLM